MYPILLKAHVILAFFAFASLLLRCYWGLKKPAMLQQALALKAHKLITLLMLLSAIALCLLLGMYPVAQAWLTEKLVLFVLYVGLGIAAIRPGAPDNQRLVLTGAAAVCFVLMMIIAKSHSALLLG